MRKRDLALKPAAAPVQSLPNIRNAALRRDLGNARELLELSFDQAGRIFQVSGETVRRWETGATMIPASSWERISSFAQETDRLLQLFEIHRLPMVIRRQAEMFSGRTALDLIFEGRIQEVADLYEAALLYQA